MNQLPSGTVTFLFTDIEGNTKFVQRSTISNLPRFASLDQRDLREPREPEN